MPLAILPDRRIARYSIMMHHPMRPSDPQEALDHSRVTSFISRVSATVWVE